MATLTDTAYYARKYIKWGIIGLIAFIILRIIFGWVLQYILSTIPPPPIKPNNALGRLPKIAFPQGASPSSQLTFTINTIDGDLPEASNTAYVYFMPKNRANLLSLSRAQSFANSLGFTTSPSQVTKILYRWVDIKNPLRTMEMDIVSNHFTLKYLFAHDLTLFTERAIPTPQEAQEETATFLGTLGVALDDIEIAAPIIQYLKLVGNELVSTTSQSQADAVKVDYFRTGYHGLPAMTDNPREGNISFILSGSRLPDKRILSVKFTYWPVDLNTVGIYALKTPLEAWNELTAGNTYIAQLPTNKTQIAINDVRLAYFDGSLSQLYYQPVFVFSGDDFTAYVPAVAPPYTD